jgi:hypothetical protein
MTVRELFREFAAERFRARDRFDRDTLQAWQVVRIYFQSMNDKKMPAIDSLMSDRAAAQPRVQSREEQLEALKMLSQMYGGKLITITRPAAPAA